MKTSKIILLAVLLTGTMVSMTPAKKVRIFTIGDSGMHVGQPQLDTTYDISQGWGDAIQAYFDDKKVEIHNCALPGRSSKSYINEGVWQKVLDQLAHGDYLVAGFGGNDQKSADTTRYTDPQTTFKENFRRFITEARAKGAIPILVTSYPRRRFDKKGQLVETLGDYVPAIREVGTEMNVPVIDMNVLVKKLVQSYGVDGSVALYAHVKAGQVTRFPEGNTDNSHLSYRGARKVAGLFIQELRDTNHPLAKFLKKEYRNKNWKVN